MSLLITAMLIPTLVQLVAAHTNLTEGSEKADSFDDEHHGLHVHHHDLWVHPNTIRNKTKLKNVTTISEHGVKDILGIIKKEEIAKNIMQKVKDILAVGKTEDSPGIFKSTEKSKSQVEAYLDLIDSINELPESGDAELNIVTNNVEEDDNGNIDYTEYEDNEYFADHQRDYERDDDYFDTLDDAVMNNTDAMAGLLKKAKKPRMRIAEAAFPELLSDLLDPRERPESRRGI